MAAQKSVYSRSSVANQAPNASSSGSKVTAPRGGSSSGAWRGLLLEWLLPLLAGLIGVALFQALMQAGGGSPDASLSRSLGRVRVEVAGGDAQTLEGRLRRDASAIVVELAVNAEDSGAVRLGDAPFGLQRAGHALLRAVVADSRYRIAEAADDRPGAPGRPTLMSWLLPSSVHAAEPSGKASPRDLNSPAPVSDLSVEGDARQQQLPPEGNAVPQPEAARQQQAPGRAVGLPTARPVVQAACTVALLRADSARARTVVLDGRSAAAVVAMAQGDYAPRAAESTREAVWLGVADAVLLTAPRLRHVERIEVTVDSGAVGSDVLTTELERRIRRGIPGAMLANLGDALHVPLPWVGFSVRAGLTPHRPTDPLTDAAGFYHPLARRGAAAPRRTALPATALLLLSAFVLWMRLRTLPARRHAASWRAPAMGLVTVAVLLLADGALDRAWRAGPTAWIASIPGLMFLGAVAGLCNGLGVASLRGWAFARQAVQPESDHALRSVLHRDKPLEDLAEDRLGFAPLVHAMRRFLDNRATLPPVVISVNGPWGSGKSSVMKMLAAELRRTGRFRTVWFNAWQYHQEEQILAAFLKSIADQLSSDFGLWFRVRIAWARVRRYSYWQFVALLAPSAVVLAALVVPELRPNLPDLETLGDAGNLLGGELLSRVKKLGALDWAFGASTVTVVSWALRFARPFRLPFKKLSTVSDQRTRLGFLDEFAREFSLYREAVGTKKFLILIDDLDRCPPDKIVDVLKTINLVITGSAGADRTFFVLGYDPKYIHRGILHHFREFAESNGTFDERFAVDYLKKMVTLSVSVPVPDQGGIEGLVQRLDTAGRDAARPRASGLRASVALGLRRALLVPPWAVNLGLALVTVAAALLLLGQWWRQASHGPAAGPPLDTGAQTSAFTSPLTAIAGPPELPGDPPPTPPWVWLPLIALLPLGAVAAWLRSRAMDPERRYERPEEDSALFRQSIERCKGLLPGNPRDVIRLVNLMRMQYLVQTQQELRPGAAGGQNPASPFPGQPLDEWETVSCAVLQQRYPHFFDPDFALPHVVSLRSAPASGETAALDQTQPPTPTKAADWYAQLGGQLRWLAGFGIDIRRIEDAGGSTRHLMDPDKLTRYVTVNRFVLDLDAPQPDLPAPPSVPIS